MNKFKITGLSVILVSLSLTASATDFDGSKPIICAPTDVMECVPAGDCKRTSSEAIAAPRFIKIDMQKKVMTARFHDSERVSPIERSETVDEKLMLQGVEDGYENVRDGVGWTLSVSMDKGHMVLTASGDEVAFVMFGSCTYLSAPGLR